MMAQCTKCGNYDWDKSVEGNTVICPKCSNRQEFKKLPLFIITGCSGVGKTTTAQCLISMGIDAVVLDSDYFHGMFENSESGYQSKVEKLEDLSKSIMQCGYPVIWTMAGNLDMLNKAYNRRFFSDIYCIALVCSEHSLRQRMEKGRGITDQGWIESSVDYNNYFKNHSKIGDLPYDICDIEDMTPQEVALAVSKWFKAKMQ